MVNSKINNLKVYSPSINKILREDRYDADDITEAEAKFIQKHTPKPRVPRMDLSSGDIVIVLEGAYCGKRVIFIEQIPECKAVVSGISCLNGVSAFIIDERYLLKLNTRIEIPRDLVVDKSSLIESKMYEAEKIDVEACESSKPFENMLLTSVSKIPYMKSYLSEMFKVDNEAEFYSLGY